MMLLVARDGFICVLMGIDLGYMLGGVLDCCEY